MSVTDRTEWAKASASTAAGACVEMRRNHTAFEVRDSKQFGVGPTLRFTSTAFASWLEGAKNGEYDKLS
jgi:hypothetical protein